MSSAVVVFVSLCGLLVAGKFVRIKVPLLQRLYLPSSVIGGFVLSRLFGVPPCFGNLIEIGFEGGHGTVGGMTESFLAAGSGRRSRSPSS